MMRLNGRNRRPGTRGFSLVELLVVAAIVLIIAAVAVPNILQGMRFLRLRSTATNIATLLQQARMRSVRDNRSYQVVTRPLDPNTNSVFIDLNFNGQYTPGEPITTLPADVQISNAAPNGAPDIFITQAMAPNGLGGAQPLSLQVTSPAQGAPGATFNPRGVPCLVPGGAYSSNFAVCNTTGGGAQPIGYVVYLQSTTIANDGWSAVTVSPGGRIRSWIFAPGTPNRWR